MAEQDSAQDRTEQPTEKRLREAKEKGQIPRSREFNTVVMLLASVIGLMSFGEIMSDELRVLLTMDLSLERSQVFDKSAIVEALRLNTFGALKLLTPFFAVMLLAVFIGPMFMGGLSFSSKALTPNFNKLNPLSGFKRMFGLQGLVELLKALAKFLLIAASAAILLQILTERYLSLGQASLLRGLESGMDLLGIVFLVLSSTLLLVAVVDVPYQKWNHIRKLRMTRQQIKEEAKETNGNPELKSRIRSLQMDMANRRMMLAVPNADVVIVNPTHFSVALRYEQTAESAPKVVAKGVDHVALKIREIADRYDVPVFEAPPLARALYHHCEIDQEIPEELYLAVAKVLAYVYQVNQQAAGNPAVAEIPADIPVPDKFLRDN